MLIKIFLAFILIPLVELFLLIWVADLTSPLTTILLVIVTGVIGTILARRQGLQALRRFQQATAAGRIPAREIQEGMMIGLAAILLLTPGILSDTAGFLLLIPRVREMIRQALVRRLTGKLRVHVSGASMRSAASSGYPESVRPVEPPRMSRPDVVDAVNVRPLSDR